MASWVLGIARWKWKEYVVLESRNVAADFVVPVVMEGSPSLDSGGEEPDLASTDAWTTMDVAGSKLGREPMEDTLAVSQLVETWNATKWAATVMDL